MSRKTYSILKFRRGNTAVSNALTGAQGELFVDLQANTLVMHDGITVGGHRIATEKQIIRIQGIDDVQNTLIESVQANTIYTQGVDAEQNTTIELVQANVIYIQGVVDSQNAIIESVQANVVYIQGVSEGQNTSIQSSFDQANTGTILAQASYDYANTIMGLDANVDQVARDAANNVSSNTIYTQGVDESQNTSIQAAFDQANTGTTLTQSAFDQANTSANDIIVIQGVNDTQNTNIENVNTLAQAAFDYANTQLGNYSFSDDTITNDVNNDITLTTNGNNWTFGANGNLVVPGSIIPQSNTEYSLGTPDRQWKSLYVSGNTIYIERVPLSLTSEGNTNILSIGAGDNSINIASETYVQSFQNIDGGSANEVYSYNELLNLDGGGA